MDPATPKWPDNSADMTEPSKAEIGAQTGQDAEGRPAAQRRGPVPDAAGWGEGAWQPPASAAMESEPANSARQRPGRGRHSAVLPDEDGPPEARTAPMRTSAVPAHVPAHKAPVEDAIAPLPAPGPDGGAPIAGQQLPPLPGPSTATPPTAPAPGPSGPTPPTPHAPAGEPRPGLGRSRGWVGSDQVAADNPQNRAIGPPDYLFGPPPGAEAPGIDAGEADLPGDNTQGFLMPVLGVPAPDSPGFEAPTLEAPTFSPADFESAGPESRGFDVAGFGEPGFGEPDLAAPGLGESGLVAPDFGLPAPQFRDNRGGDADIPALGASGAGYATFGTRPEGSGPASSGPASSSPASSGPASSSPASSSPASSGTGLAGFVAGSGEPAWAADPSTERLVWGASAAAPDSPGFAAGPQAPSDRSGFSVEVPAPHTPRFGIDSSAAPDGVAYNDGPAARIDRPYPPVGATAGGWAPPAGAHPDRGQHQGPGQHSDAGRQSDAGPHSEPGPHSDPRPYSAPAGQYAAAGTYRGPVGSYPGPGPNAEPGGEDRAPAGPYPGPGAHAGPGQYPGKSDQDRGPGQPPAAGIPWPVTTQGGSLPPGLARVSDDHAPCQGVPPGGDGFTGPLAPMT